MPNIKVLNETTININETVVVKMPISITNNPHVFIGYTFLQSGVPVIPQNGTILFTATPENMPNSALPLSAPADAPIDATLAVPVLADLAGNIISVTVLSESITQADEVKIIVTANDT